MLHREVARGTEALPDYAARGAWPVYWRVTQRRGGAACGRDSATWWYVPEPGSDAREGFAWRAAADVDANGIVDFLASGHFADRAYLFFGAPEGLSMTPRVLARSGGVHFGGGFVVGDLDGDGLPELNVAQGNAVHNDTLWIYRGGVGGFASDVVSLSGPGPNSTHYSPGITDLDGDGFGDLVSSADWSNPAATDGGRVYVYRGGAPFTPERTIAVQGTGEPGLRFGKFVTIADVNNDGRDDLLIATLNAAQYQVYLNDGGHFPAEPAVTLERTFAALKRALGLHTLHTCHVNGILIQLWATLLLYQVLGALRGAVAHARAWAPDEVSWPMLMEAVGSYARHPRPEPLPAWLITHATDLDLRVAGVERRKRAPISRALRDDLQTPRVPLPLDSIRPQRPRRRPDRFAAKKQTKLSEKLLAVIVRDFPLAEALN